MSSNTKNNRAEVDWKEFYNYRYWREAQRNQLTIVSNLYFVLSSAMIGYSVNLLIKQSEYQITIECSEKTFLLLGIIINIISLALYICLTDNKLKDYRETAKLIQKEVKNYSDIGSSTFSYGDKTWCYFKYQKLSMIAGFILCTIGYSILVFK